MLQEILFTGCLNITLNVNVWPSATMNQPNYILGWFTIAEGHNNYWQVPLRPHWPLSELENTKKDQKNRMKDKLRDRKKKMRKDECKKNRK